MNDETKNKLIKEAEGFLAQALDGIKSCEEVRENDYASFRYEIGYFRGKIDALRAV